MSIKSMSGLPGGLTAQAPPVMTVISCPPCTSLTHSPGSGLLTMVRGIRVLLSWNVTTPEEKRGRKRPSLLPRKTCVVTERQWARKSPSDSREKTRLVYIFLYRHGDDLFVYHRSHLIGNFHLTVESSRGTAKNPGLKLRADFGSWLQSRSADDRGHLPHLTLSLDSTRIGWSYITIAFSISQSAFLHIILFDPCNKQHFFTNSSRKSLLSIYHVTGWVLPLARSKR